MVIAGGLGLSCAFAFVNLPVWRDNGTNSYTKKLSKMIGRGISSPSWWNSRPYRRQEDNEI